MENGEGSASAATLDKSRTSDKVTPQERIDAFVEAARVEGCQFKTMDATDTVKACGAPPHRVKQTPPKDGKIKLLIDCAAGHAEQWEIEFDAAELIAASSKQRDALKKTENEVVDSDPSDKNDPMIARIEITMDIRSQEVKIKPFVPTPLVGLGMLAVCQKSFFDQMAEQETRPAHGLELPGEKKIVGTNGLPLT
jgi:hypothetical protein